MASDSASLDQIEPGVIRVNVKPRGTFRHACIETSSLTAVCVFPTDKSPPGSQFTCVMASSNGGFSGRFTTQSEMVAALAKFITKVMGPDTKVPIDQLLLQ